MKLFLGFIVVVLVGGGVYFFINRPAADTAKDLGNAVAVDTAKGGATSTPAVAKNDKETIIGTSVEGRAITAYHFGDGDKEILFVGGAHGGYSWNTALVAYELMGYLTATPSAIASGVRVTVVPVLNPDGLRKVVAKDGRFTSADVNTSESIQKSARFNANTVDLNRNFDCAWKATGTWQEKTVSGGKSAFSEPESAAIKSYVEAHKLAAAVVWYSAAGGVYASQCGSGIMKETRGIMNTFAKASGYAAYDNFDFYEVTGDMVNWIAKQKIPAISVLLTTHDAIEWDKNRTGIDAVLKQLAQ